MIRTAIIYHSRYGATKEIAGSLAAGFESDTELKSSKEATSELLENSGRIIIGGPIYAGKISGRLLKLCERNKSLLLEREVGLFISCLYHDERADTQLLDAFPGWLMAHATHADWLGGRVTLDRLKYFDRLIASRFAGLQSDVDLIRIERVTAFIEAFSDH